MNRARSTHSIGLAGGVLSIAGLCIGILKLGKKTPHENSARPADPRPPRSEHNSKRTEIATLEPTGPELPEEILRPANSVTEEVRAPEPSREHQSAAETIADLARSGESPLAIAQALGISMGEVQLTLKLQQRSASAGRSH
jgi:hypothetical protein